MGIKTSVELDVLEMLQGSSTDSDRFGFLPAANGPDIIGYPSLTPGTSPMSAVWRAQYE